MIATLIMHGKTGYPVLWALSMIKYRRSRLKINLVLSGSTVKLDTKSNTQLGPELSEQIKVVIGQHLQKIATNIKTKYKAFMTCMSDAVRKNPGKNPKRFGRNFK